jgi:hypothetical protein
MSPRGPETNDGNDQRPRASVRALSLGLAIAVAGLLGFAAFAKATTKPPATGDVMGWAQIGAETLAAILILALHRKCWAWGIVAIIFAAFSGFTMHRLFGGARSCGCFGKFTVAPPITISIDAAVVAMSLGMACALGMMRRWMWLVASLLIPAAIGGGLYAMSLPTPEDFKAGGAFERAWQERQRAAADGSTATAPEATTTPVPVEFDPLGRAPDVLMLLPAVQDDFLKGEPAPAWLTRLGEATAPGEGPAWLVFVYDPHCDVCQKFLPFYEGYERDSADDDLLRVVTVKKADLVPFQIEDWAWTHSPTVLLIKGGAIIQEWGGEEAPMPGAVRERIANEGEAYFEAMRAGYEPLQ